MLYGPGGGCSGGPEPHGGYGHGPHGPHGCCHGPHGPGGWYGRPWGPPPGPWGPPPGPWGPPPRFFYGAVSKSNKIDYMKTIDYDGEGKKYYSACACKNCTEPFAVDYRLIKNLTFICTSDLGFKNGTFYSDNKIDGYFKFEIVCPSCDKATPFFIKVRKLPNFVLDYYLKETKSVEYTIKYSYDNFYAPFNVTYDTCGTTIKGLYEKINSLHFDAIDHDDKKIPTTLEKMNDAVTKEYTKKSGKNVTINMDSVHENLKKEIEVNKLKLLKYLIKSNGLLGFKEYVGASNQTKNELKLLSK